MNVESLYRDRLVFAGVVGVAALALVAHAVRSGSGLALVPAALLAVASILTFRLARESYRFDRGEIGPPEWRAIVRESDEWARHGRRQDEVAGDATPCGRPSECREKSDTRP